MVSQRQEGRHRADTARGAGGGSGQDLQPTFERGGMWRSAVRRGARARRAVRRGAVKRSAPTRPRTEGSAMEAETVLQKQHCRGTRPGRQNRPEQTPPDHAARPRRSAATTRFYACASARICRSTAEPPGGAAGPRLPAPPLVPGARGAAARRGRYPPRQRGLSGRHGEETQEAQVGQAPLRGWVGKGVAKRAPSLGPAGRAQLKGRGKPGPGGEPRPGLGTRGRAGRGETA